MLRQVADGLRELGQALRPHAVPLFVIAAMLGVLYWSTLKWLWNAWMYNDYYGHGLLMPLVSGWFAWRARRKMALQPEAATQPQNLWGLGLALAVYAYGYYLRDPFVLSLSLILAIAGLAVYIVGPRRARYLALPSAFLLLAVPIPNLLDIGLVLQQFASWGTTAFMSFFGTDVWQDNFTLHAGALTFQVVPMCSGLSSSISILTLTTVVTAITPLRAWGKATLLLLAVPIALAANILRIAVTVWIGMAWGPEASQSFLHGFSSLFLFLLALGIVLALAAILGRIDKKFGGPRLE